MKTDTAVLSPIIYAVQSKLQGAKTLVVAIDGCCGSGKTYYSGLLAEYFGATVISCDDFFLPVTMRSAERLGEVGGNIHYERLWDVLSKVRQGKAFTYSAYVCSTDSFEKRKFEPARVVIVEGSYALHRQLDAFYDVKVLLTVDKQTQYDRLLKREGAEGVANFTNKWIPLENRYFATLDTTDCLIIKTD